MRQLLVMVSQWLVAVHLLTPFTHSQTPSPPKPERGYIVGVPDSEQKPLRLDRLYAKSYALVIGMHKYESWSPLPGVLADVDAIAGMLRRHDFEVEVARDLASGALMKGIADFIKRHDSDPQNRLLIYYAGHGYRHKPAHEDKMKGYLVPVDAPFPREEHIEPFLAKVVNIDEVLALVNNIQAKHLFLVLDSCYAGSIINSVQANRAEPGFVAARFSSMPAGRLQDTNDSSPQTPHNIFDAARERAHLFVASGTDKQSVPDDSEFRKKFVQGLTDESGQGADLDGDSYVTGTELRQYLQTNVTNNSRGSQRPISGVIGSQAANQGDFVFVLPGAAAKEVMLGPAFDPALWAMPQGWSFNKNSLLALSPGLMLPKELVRHSFRNFEYVTRLKLKNNMAVRLVLRAQDAQNYYLLRLTGGNFPNKKERFLLHARVVQGGQESAELTGSPLPVNERELVKKVNYEDAIQIGIIVKDNRFTVSLRSGAGNTSGLPLIAPVQFIDQNKTFRYGAPGFLTVGSEQLQVLSLHVYKFNQHEKAGL